MLRHAIYLCVFVLSFTAAQAETAKNYFGVAAIIDAELSVDDPTFADSDFHSGFILSYGRQIQDQISLEIAHAKYADNGSGFLQSELVAFDVSGLYHFNASGPFIRLGYSDGDLKAPVFELSTVRFLGTISESQSGPTYGVGFDIPVQNNAAAIRIEYNNADYDDGEIKRLTLGTLIRF